MPNKIEAVIFDLDGVITDTASFHYKAWKVLADELDIYFDEKINELLKGVDRLGSLEIILRNSSKTYSLEEKNGLGARKNEYYKDLVNMMTPKDILPGALEVLKDVKERGLKTGLASVSKNAFAVIGKLQIGQYFDYMVDAVKIRNGKPNPEIFLNAAENLRISPGKCIGIEDAEVGIKAIKSAGMYAVGIGDPEILKEADDVVKGLDFFNIEKYLNQ